MTPEDLGRIEHALGLKLPAAYRDAMMAYPFPEQSPAAELWVLNHVGQLLELNAEHRRASEGRWDPHLVLIGTDGGEETFVLDMARAPYPVLIYEMETGSLKPCAPDFSSFIQMHREELERIEADERDMAEAYRNKRWWQFWIRPPQAGGAPMMRTPPDHLRAGPGLTGWYRLEPRRTAVAPPSDPRCHRTRDTRHRC